MKVLRKTQSLCPVCMKVLDAEVYVDDDNIVRIRKTCPEHGYFDETYTFSDYELYQWAEKYAHDGNGIENPMTSEVKGCPFDCGICPNHKSHTVLAIIDVTNRCNMRCPVCVAGDELLLIKNSNEGKLLTIEEIATHVFNTVGSVPVCPNVEYADVSHLSIMVPVVNNDGRVEWSRIAKIYRKRNVSKLLEIETHTGRRLKVTFDHPLIVFRNGRLKKIYASELRQHDYLCVLGKLTLGGKNEFCNLDVLSILRSAPTYELLNVYVRNVGSYLKWLKEQVGSYAKISRIASIKTWNYWWNIKGYMPILQFYKLIEHFELPLQFKRVIKLGVKGKKYSLPAIIPLTSNWIRFIALFVSEGHLDYTPGQTYNITLTAKDARKIIKMLEEIGVKSYLIDYSRYGKPLKTPQVRISNKILLLIFLFGLKLGKKACEKQLPSFTPSLPLDLLKIMLSELFDRDGSVVRSSRRTYILYKTTSRRLVQQLQYILALFGISTRTYMSPSSNNPLAKHDAYELQVSSKPELEKVLQILLDNSKTARKLKKLLPRKGRSTFKRLGDILLDQVKSIREIENSSNVVYDLEVQHPSHSFLVNSIFVGNCFANAAAAGYVYEPSLKQIEEMLKTLRSIKPVPPPALQLSGGEPTVRRDLPEIIRMAKEIGFDHIEVNTNGLVLAENIDYYKSLLDAGMSTIYLQFDGVTDDIYIKLRGIPLFEKKLKVIENARKLGHESIVLVVTLTKGVNDHQLGDIIKFAMDNSDVVRCVNVQPISFSGRATKLERDAMRINTSDFMKLVEEQTDGLITRWDFRPVPSVVPISRAVGALKNKKYIEFTTSPFCGVATFLVKTSENEWVPITRLADVDKFFSAMNRVYEHASKGRKTRAYMSAISALRYVKFGLLKDLVWPVLKEGSYKALGKFMRRVIMIGCMHFMDVWNFDLQRVQRCVIHYALPDGTVRPFCSHNNIHREHIERKFSIPYEKWVEMSRKDSM
ncbi:MAG: radical SAM protein [archaeon GB-1867-035]|nr:radical SAM protein [Candidatus Culexmicrobium profundum]